MKTPGLYEIYEIYEATTTFLSNSGQYRLFGFANRLTRTLHTHRSRQLRWSMCYPGPNHILLFRISKGLAWV